MRGEGGFYKQGLLRVMMSPSVGSYALYTDFYITLQLEKEKTMSFDNPLHHLSDEVICMNQLCFALQPLPLKTALRSH